MDRLCRENDVATDRGRAVIVSQMGERILRTGDAVRLDTFARKTAMRLFVSDEAVRAEFKRAGHARPHRVEVEAPPSTAAATAPSPHEFWLLRVVLGHDGLVEEAVSHLDLEWVEHPAIRRALGYRFARFASGDAVNVATMLQELDDEEPLAWSRKRRPRKCRRTRVPEC